jgi:hypothetical protein
VSKNSPKANISLKGKINKEHLPRTCPKNFVPFSASCAFLASSSFSNCTKPKPRSWIETPEIMYLTQTNVTFIQSHKILTKPKGMDLIL